MPRAQTENLPRMQNQPPASRVVEPAPPIAPEAAEPVRKRKPQIMRQYDLIERVKSYNPNANEDLLNRAYVYAMKAHGTQTRASGDPYFSHPLEVAAILTNLKLDDATIVAALLHDTIEDTEATRAEIDERFGPEIGALVDGLTKLKKLDLVTRLQIQGCHGQVQRHRPIGNGHAVPASAIRGERILKLGNIVAEGS